MTSHLSPAFQSLFQFKNQSIVGKLVENRISIILMIAYC
jgi:hypothetical protein